MSAQPGKSRLDRRLATHFATLGAHHFKDLLKRSAARWPIYAAVTSSALAMTSRAVAQIADADIHPPAPGFQATNHRFASSENSPWAELLGLPVVQARPGLHVVPASIVQATRQTPALGPPSIFPEGTVPLYSHVNTIQPGEWVSIYGNNLAAAIVNWDGDFPTTLGGTSVQVNGKPAYLSYVSPTQINLQAPDDTATGTVSVVVTTAAGSATSTVTLSLYGPSFCLQGATGYVAGVIVRTDGSGAYGGGTYDLLGPTGNSLGYSTVAAKPGDNIELYGVGFGPTTPMVPAGALFSGAAPVNRPIALYINNVSIDATFVGISEAGLYQINLTVPPLGEGDVPLLAIAGGAQTEQGVLFPLYSAPGIYNTSPPPGGGGGPTSGGGNTVGGGTTFGGGSFGNFRPHGQDHWEPRLKFEPDPIR